MRGVQISQRQTAANNMELFMNEIVFFLSLSIFLALSSHRIILAAGIKLAHQMYKKAISN